MKSRSADATIKGYYYQFDNTIIKLFELINDDDDVKVEGIEDIDINTINGIETVQCKYLSTKKCTDSIIREPIILMIEHFLKNKINPIKYTLYAHFEEEIPNERKIFNLSELKKIFTYSKKENGNMVEKKYFEDNNISDNDLNDFINNFKLIYGYEFNQQHQQILDKIESVFLCSRFEAEHYFYNNALRIILDLAIKKVEKNRVVKKREFFDALNCGKKLFNAWFIKFKKHDEYLNQVKQNLKDVKALISSKTKIIVIGRNILIAENSDLPVVSFIHNLINKYYKIGFVKYDILPFTLILDLEETQIIDLKKQLIKNGTKFNDGYEHIYFNNNIFLEKPIINKKKNSIRISKTSYELRIISKYTLDKNPEIIEKHHVLFYFSNEDYNYHQITDKKNQVIDIKYCKN
ncbi:MAG: DUF4297 family anti-phage-associated protein, partial [FCB group bacterium]